MVGSNGIESENGVDQVIAASVASETGMALALLQRGQL